MDGLHIHLLLNHFPVIGTIIGVLTLIFGFIRQSDEIKRLSMGIFFALALLAIPVYLTGEPAEERVEKSIGVSEAIIKQHEDAALPALIAMEITGFAALIGLILLTKKSSLARWNVFAVFALALVTFGLMARTANLGGQIRHQEIRAGAATNIERRDAAEQKENEDDDNKD